MTTGVSIPETEAINRAFEQLGDTKDLFVFSATRRILEQSTQQCPKATCWPPNTAAGKLSPEKLELLLSGIDLVAWASTPG
jgi:hypothetical protein